MYGKIVSLKLTAHGDGVGGGCPGHDTSGVGSVGGGADDVVEAVAVAEAVDVGVAVLAPPSPFRFSTLPPHATATGTATKTKAPTI
jgi:hypothetical protein